MPREHEGSHFSRDYLVLCLSNGTKKRAEIEESCLLNIIYQGNYMGVVLVNPDL